MNKEELEKISKCKSIEEVLILAKTNNKNITREEAKKAFDMTHANGELTDEEVSNVSGGAGAACNRNAYEDVAFDSEKDVQFIFNIKQNIQYYYDKSLNDTSTAYVIARRAEFDSTTLKWYDVYDVKFLGPFKTKVYTHNNMRRSNFEK